ncbi:DUF4649 family protein [Streptococcus gallolyticus]|uniref:DUF4649 family protein n=1 Tax=Streptococcus hepaticus TaxID=3349163 RepID=UPI001C93B55F|nr:DUF4649 family protein [Streptococcus gallolyticus]MBY5041279.1 DUF4649 family protein [Streptococcus gallolyticus]
MIELEYLDFYQQTRKQTFDTFDELLLAFSGCSTLPDHLKVVSLTQNGQNLGYTGLIGDLYHFLKEIDPKK